jgi:type I restriction enzyme S subunit
MKKYDLYKDSGIERLGKIPKHWEVKRVKDIFSLERGKFTHRPRNDERMYSNGYYPFIQTGDVAKSSKYVVKYKQVLNENGIQVSRKFEKGTLLMTIAAKIGDVAILDFDAYFPDSLVAFKTKFNTDFYYYVLSVTKSELDTVKVTNTQDNLNLERLNGLTKIFPPISEQEIIAKYLNSKTQAIDKKKNLLEQKIASYKDLSKSLINDYVTKGHKKNVAILQNELGFKTPQKWHKERLKDIGQLFSGLSGKSGKDFNQDGNPNNKGFIPFTNIANNTYLKRDQLGIVAINEGENQHQVKQGDLFFLMSSEGYEDIGKTAILAADLKETYLNSFCKGYRITSNKCNPYFLNYLLLSDHYRQLLIVEGKGFTRINLKMEKVKDFIVYIPDTLSAQNEIVKYLDEKLEIISDIITNIQSQITTLKELRKSLIKDAVTGKIKVTDD